MHYSGLWCLGLGLLLSTTVGAEPAVYARVMSVYDGDTFTAEADVWPGHTIETRVRISGVDTPEVGGRSKCDREQQAGVRARTRLSELLNAGDVLLKEVRNDKYAGRVLARVVAGGLDVANVLLAEGLAREYHGGKRFEWCSAL